MIRELRLSLFISLVVILLMVIGFAGYQMLLISNDYQIEEDLHNMLLQFRPEASDQHVTVTDLDTQEFIEFVTSVNSENRIINNSIIELQKLNSDIVGWLTVPNTDIDYPFVMSSNHYEYLRSDIYKKYANAGTLFIDYRCSNDFSTFNTIIYGHHMKNGSMFGTLKNFNDQEFFNKNKYGIISLPERNYALEFFALILVDSMDTIIYDIIDPTEEEKTLLLEHIAEKSLFSRVFNLDSDDRIVMLSTCSYEYSDARMVLIGKIIG